VHSQRGFTLIELLVAVSIGGILLGLALPSLTKFSLALVREQARGEIVADLRYGHQLAVTRHTSVIIAFGNGVGTTDIKTYTMHSDLNGNRAVDSGEPFLSRMLPAGAVLTSVALVPRDSVVFDMSGALQPGTTGGRILLMGPDGTPDTLSVSAVGVVYRQ
jgi:type IV fimbrial biogenesis protein FimT